MKDLTLSGSLGKHGTLEVKFTITDDVSNIYGVILEIDELKNGLQDELETHFIDLLRDVTSIIHGTTEKHYLTTNVFSLMSNFMLSAEPIIPENHINIIKRKVRRVFHHSNMLLMEKFETDFRDTAATKAHNSALSLFSFVSDQLALQRRHLWNARYIRACLRHTDELGESRKISNDLELYSPLYGIKISLLEAILRRITYREASFAAFSALIFFIITFFQTWGLTTRFVGQFPLTFLLITLSSLLIAYKFSSRGLWKDIRRELGDLSFIHSKPEPLAEQ